jgi:mono/diheme cytochrome c family protein
MIAFLLAAAAATASAAPAQPGHAPAATFERYCSACHGAKGWATKALAARLPPDQALLANRRDLTPETLHAVLRHGIGSMPQFTPTELDDREIAALAAWLASGEAAKPRK